MYYIKRDNLKKFSRPMRNLAEVANHKKEYSRGLFIRHRSLEEVLDRPVLGKPKEVYRRA